MNAAGVPSRATLGHVKFLAGALSLDFANTLSGRMDEVPVERVVGFADLVDWAEAGGAVDEERARLLRRAGAERRSEAMAVLAQAVGLRAAIHQIFAAAARGRRPEDGALDRLNLFLGEAARHRRLVPSGRGAAWRWHCPEDALDRPLWPIAQSAAELLTGPALVRVKECPGAHCGWLFLDSSKNGSRRWCEMAVCGNRAKAHRFKQRLKREAKDD